MRKVLSHQATICASDTFDFREEPAFPWRFCAARLVARLTALRFRFWGVCIVLQIDRSSRECELNSFGIETLFDREVHSLNASPLLTSRRALPPLHDLDIQR